MLDSLIEKYKEQMELRKKQILYIAYGKRHLDFGSKLGTLRFGWG